MKPLEKRGIQQARKSLIPTAKGHVLEIGSGTGVNVKLYNQDIITSLTLSDIKLNKKLRSIIKNNVQLKELSVEELPFEDNTFDTIVHTLVFCSVKHVEQGVCELKRVLKPNGRLLFIEHILPEKKRMKRLFKMINPFWKRIASGCHLTRDYEQSLLDNGFTITHSAKFMNTVFVYGEATI